MIKLTDKLVFAIIEMENCVGDGGFITWRICKSSYSCKDYSVSENSANSFPEDVDIEGADLLECITKFVKDFKKKYPDRYKEGICDYWKALDIAKAVIKFEKFAEGRFWRAEKVMWNQGYCADVNAMNTHSYYADSLTKSVDDLIADIDFTYSDNWEKMMKVRVDAMVDASGLRKEE